MSVYERVTNQIIDLIEKDNCLPWTKPWSAQVPRNASGREYRGINRFILSLAPFADPRYVTFKQAIDLGGSVRKGEKGIQVVFWKWPELDTDCDGNTKPNHRCPFAKSFTVFNVEQCEGLSLLATEAVERTQDERIDAAELVLAGMKYPPRVVIGGDVACYIPSQDVIHMPKAAAFRSAQDEVSIRFHEEVHATGHSSRLNREAVAKLNRSDEVKLGLEELTAQLGSQFICSTIGIESTVEASAAYVQSWLGALKNDKTMIFKAARQAQEAADWIQGVRGNEREEAA